MIAGLPSEIREVFGYGSAVPTPYRNGNSFSGPILFRHMSRPGRSGSGVAASFDLKRDMAKTELLLQQLLDLDTDVIGPISRLRRDHQMGRQRRFTLLHSPEVNVADACNARVVCDGKGDLIRVQTKHQHTHSSTDP